MKAILRSSLSEEVEPSEGKATIYCRGAQERPLRLIRSVAGRDEAGVGDEKELFHGPKGREKGSSQALLVGNELSRWARRCAGRTSPCRRTSPRPLRPFERPRGEAARTWSLPSVGGEAMIDRQTIQPGKLDPELAAAIRKQAEEMEKAAQPPPEAPRPCF